MTNLIRYNLFEDNLDDLFKGFFVRPQAFERSPAVPVRMDVAETDTAYTVHAEMPGVKKEDIHITIDGNQVAIAAEVKHDHEDKQGNKLLRAERYYGKVYRAFSLAGEVDQTGAEAKYNEGVLELRLPKKAAASARKLAIQ